MFNEGKDDQGSVRGGGNKVNDVVKVKTWFQNRRMKHKKQMRKLHDNNQRPLQNKTISHEDDDQVTKNECSRPMDFSLNSGCLIPTKHGYEGSSDDSDQDIDIVGDQRPSKQWP